MPNTELGFWGQQFMIWVLILMPGFGIASYIRVHRKKPLPPKKKRYRGAILGQAIILSVTLLAARQHNISILSGPLPSLYSWFLAVLFLVVMGIRLKRAWKRLSPERLERARIILPDDLSQMHLWVTISALAGISEECAYRGLAIRFLTANQGSFSLALLLCITAFAVAHAVQGWRGIVTTAIIAALMHGVVYVTGSLYIPIVVHAVYDLMVGIIAVPILSEITKAQEAIQAVTA